MTLHGTQHGAQAYYVDARWQQLPLIHGFGTRNAPVQQIVGAGMCAVTKQVHGHRVHVLRRVPRQTILNGDAFITAASGVVCAVRTADCVPILVLDRVRRVCGAIHAGWQGLAHGVIDHAIEAIAMQFRVPRERLEAAIGPAIGLDDYEVDAIVLTALEKAKLPISDVIQETTPGHWLIDLKCLAEKHLISAGVAPHRIARTSLSTFRRAAEFHSYRREPGNPGRQVSFIMWK